VLITQKNSKPPLKPPTAGGLTGFRDSVDILWRSKNFVVWHKATLLSHPSSFPQPTYLSPARSHLRAQSPANHRPINLEPRPTKPGNILLTILISHSIFGGYGGHSTKWSWMRFISWHPILMMLGELGSWFE
jgi:hypothetical protein